MLRRAAQEFSGQINRPDAQIVQVLYGTGSYDPQVTGSSGPTMGNFFSDVLGTNSGYIGLLSQYSTNISGGTDQIIGNGTFGGIFQITPSAGNNGSTIDDSNIQAELLAQINAGHLPAPGLDAAGNVNTIYMIYFPPGKTITDQGFTSCIAGGFCAYHSTTSNTLNSKHLLYGVLPDFQTGGCSTGCGASSVFGNYTTVTSHELSETITDADVGIAGGIAAPLAWYDPNNGEIGDICNLEQGSYTADGTTYTIQLEFSNAANNCVLPSPVAQSPCVLKPNQVLSQNQTLPSCPTGFTLAMQGDGNLVLYENGVGPLWYSHTYNPGSPNRATHAIMQSDGNFVLYNDSGVPLFATGTQGNPGATLSVQGDGNMVVYSPSAQPLWNSGTGAPR